jgi:hypothetical protein
MNKNKILILWLIQTIILIYNQNIKQSLYFQKNKNIGKSKIKLK